MVHALLDRLRGSVAVVAATHELGLAASCDRVVLLASGGAGRPGGPGGPSRPGRIEAIGAPSAILTPERLAAVLGVQIRRLDDPDGGPPLFGVVAPMTSGASVASGLPVAPGAAVASGAAVAPLDREVAA